MMLQLVKRHSLEIKVTDCFDMSKFFSLKSTFLKIDLSLLSRKADSISHSIQRYCEVITVHVYHFIKKCYSLNCLGLLSKEFASELAA